MKDKAGSGGNNGNLLFSNKYDQVRLLGEGSFGKAFLVECIEDKSLAVIKSIDLGSMTEEEKNEAFQEGKILEKLDHPNIIKFREVIVEKKSNSKHTLHIVMDYADGGDLQQRIKGQKGKLFNENQILDWFTQICLAIKHIHDRKILHRDVKSQNIFLTKNGLVKLGDFGIAKCLSQTIDKAKTIVGTPYYLSPEIINNQAYDFKSDIWSLGVLLYEICALKMPFDAPNLPLLSMKIIRCSCNPLPPNFSRELRNLVMIMLNVNINKRPTINEILRQPIIKSRIKIFLNEIEYNREFSHTILHKFNIFKRNKMEIESSKESKEVINLLKENSIGNKFDSNSSQEGKEKLNNNFIKEKEKDKDISKDIPQNPHQKPIIKKEEKPVTVAVANIGNNNLKIKKNYQEKEKESVTMTVGNSNILKDKELENILLLKKNLMGGFGKDGNLQGNNEKKHALIINPSFGINYEKQKVKSSIEIDSSRTPKIDKSSEVKLEKRQNSDKRLEPPNKDSIENNARPGMHVKGNKDSKDVIGKDSLSKKNSERDITTCNTETGNTPISVNVSINIQDKKRSDSRGSGQDDKNSMLKDFMKNMKEKIKSNPPNIEGSVIWMKGMKDFIDMEREKEKELEREKKEKEKENELVRSNNFLNNFKPLDGKKKNSKDLKEYVEAQKMLLELEKLQNEDYEEEFATDNNYPCPENPEEALNEDDLIEIDGILLNSNMKVYDNDSNNNYNKNILKDSHIVNFPIQEFIEPNNDAIEQSLKKEIESEVGRDLYNSVYKILSENLNDNILSFEYDNLSKKIKTECGRFDSLLLEAAISRVPDIYCIILKERKRRI